MAGKAVTILTSTTIRQREPLVIVVPTPSMKRFPKQRHAKRVLILFFLVYLFGSFILSRLIDGPLAQVRDPEYAARRDRLLARQAESPDRPIVLALGSSRMVEGLRPDALNPPGGPLILNGGMVGSGSMLELMTYRRLKRDGLKPTRVLVEYWPPLLRGDNHAEYGRIDLPRLSPHDWPIVRDYFPDPVSVRRYLAEGQLWPIHRYRRGLMTMLDRRWVPESRHESRFTAGMDPFGWWPGVRDEDANAERRKHADPKKSAFWPFLDGFSIGEPADRALRDLIRECQADGVAVTLIFLPEGSEFRTLYSLEADSAWQTHLKSLVSEFGVTTVMARDWDFDQDLPDGVHLTQGGAKRFSERLRSRILE